MDYTIIKSECKNCKTIQIIFGNGMFGYNYMCVSAKEAAAKMKKLWGIDIPIKELKDTEQ